jgi:aspartyl protease family protein
MSRILMFAPIILVGVVAAVEHLETVGQMPTAVAAAAKANLPPVPSYSSTTVIKARLGGQFEVDARVEGRRIVFLVDTGASQITLRASDAARAAHYPSLRDYSIKVTTANGEARAAAVTLGRVEVGDIALHDVPALVMPDETLPVSLLGMSFLSRVRWSHERGNLILQQ